MKKTIAALLAVALVLGGLGGFVYANNAHEPVTGDKLVGLGHLGEKGGKEHWSGFRFTNPDCVGEIEIEKVSIIRDDGTVIYEGPYLEVEIVKGEVVSRTVVEEPMGPHEIRTLSLASMMTDWDDVDGDDDYDDGLG